MKVQIYAGALVAAADRYVEAFEKSARAKYDAAVIEYMKPKFVRFLFWNIRCKLVSKALAEAMASKHLIADNTYVRAKLFRAIAIAKHKRPETLLEITDPELQGIAPYLSEYESERI